MITSEQHAAQVRALRQQLEQTLQGLFVANGYRDADLARFVSRAVPQVLAARRQVSAITDAWLADYLTGLLGVRIRPAGPIATAELRGVDPAEVYARPHRTVWWKLSQGMALDRAVSVGAKRLTDLALSDLQLAKTRTVHRTLSDTDGVAGYARTLTGRANCGLCVVASTHFYHRGDLMPIHPGCDCGIAPQRNSSEWQAEADQLLEDTHDAIAATFGRQDRAGRDLGSGEDFPDYTKVITVQQHGELGPLLTVTGHHFTGPGF